MIAKTVLLALCASVLLLSGCAGSPQKHLGRAYQAYEAGSCEQAQQALIRAEHHNYSRGHLQPDISLLRGLCLERQALYLDAAQTYHFILRHYPQSEPGYRAGARLETLRQLGYVDPAQQLKPQD
ncbi:tetratricopeptide repeat protein [Halopseudomonas salegens]|uniref:Lipoprotein n=1 Tax=Halopseudomonas salegens TaxID=1434072 RepID=A0A1H2EJ12_9GAMM|nr:hypothetical protein [Halopseudomonas salegens]SDT95080.1 hypothetical protein SAMN05216210_0772 [Halopseudomonas salegens]